MPFHPPPLTQQLEDRARAAPDRVLAQFDTQELRYGELARDALRIAAGLREHGVGAGQPVLVMLGNRPELLVSLFALAALGALAVPVNVALRGLSLAHIFRTTAARLLITEAAFLDRIADALGAEHDLSTIFLVDAAPERAALPLASYATLARAPAADLPVRNAPEDPWLVMFTSGTTGPAKGVVMPHQQLASAAWDATQDLRIDAHAVLYTFNPLFHLNALVFGPFAALTAGARAVVRAQFPRERLRADLVATGATHWCPPPFVVRGLLAAEPAAEDAKMALRWVSTIGLLAGEIDAFQRRFGCRLTGGYGSTEAGMMCRMQNERPHLAGPPSDRYELQIVDPRGNVVPVGEVGEIWARARTPTDRMLGYYRDPQATAAAFSGDWFRTGDLGRFDGDGYLQFVDRLKDSLKRRGSNISTFEVEQALTRFSGVADAAVVGARTDPTAEEEVRAFIEVTDPQARVTWDFAALVRHCARHLAWYMVPRYVDLVDALPRTPLGKVRKSELRGVPIAPTTFDVKAAGIVVER